LCPSQIDQGKGNLAKGVSCLSKRHLQLLKFLNIFTILYYSLPYTEGVLSEILRCSSIVPSGVPHKVTVDREIRGYEVKKNTLLMANVYHIHYDPKIWGDPENFRPERYLSPDGKTFKKPEALIAFSTGRRQCLGESLARDTLFLFLTNIFQRFTVSMKESSYPKNIKNVKCLEPEVGIQLSPKPYKITLNDREL
jgi:cytochrome P450